MNYGVAICQRLRLAMFSTTPDRPNCVNDKVSWQTISARDFGFAWTTTAQRAAFGEQFGACGAVNRAIDAATAEERRVRRVHNGINVQFSDVAAGGSGFCRRDSSSTDVLTMTKLRIHE